MALGIAQAFGRVQIGDSKAVTDQPVAARQVLLQPRQRPPQTFGIHRDAGAPL